MIYLPPSLRGFVNKYAAFSTWTDHLPFGYDLVAALRPKRIVELGTHMGLSYFVFCQSVREHGIAARCYAVDTWAGDEHTGAYDDRFYRDVDKHNRENYADFSELLRMRFEEAVLRFDEASIDLLHIDGLHTYDAVRADFESWYPKVAPGGIVLFHDIAARMMDFGAWRFWDELSARHECFTFRHGFGLGVLRKPGGPREQPPLLELMFSGDEATESRLRALYVHASRHVDARRYAAFVEQVRASLAQNQSHEASPAASEPKRRLEVPEELHRNDPWVHAHGPENTGQALIELAIERLGLGDLSEVDVLDVGCGVRFAQTILNRDLPIKTYTGVDVHEPLIDYLKRAVDDPRFSFAHWNAHNAMYHAEGERLRPEQSLPIAGTFDLIWLFSVFTHLEPSDAAAMLAILRRHVRPEGRLFFSAILDSSIESFRDRIPERPLEQASYNPEYLRELVQANGWAVISVHPASAAHFIADHLICRPI